MIPSFDFYCNDFFGCQIQEDDFLRIAAKAADFIQYVIGKPWVPASNPDSTALLKAVCAVAELLQDEERCGSVVKETVGDYSVSYSSSQFTQKKLEAAKIYLSGIPALANCFSVRSFPCSHRIP